MTVQRAASTVSGTCAALGLPTVAGRTRRRSPRLGGSANGGVCGACTNPPCQHTLAHTKAMPVAVRVAVCRSVESAKLQYSAELLGCLP